MKNSTKEEINKAHDLLKAVAILSAATVIVAFKALRAIKKKK